MIDFWAATLPPAFGGLATPLKFLRTHQSLLQPAGSPTPPSAGGTTPGKPLEKSDEGRRPGGI